MFTHGIGTCTISNPTMYIVKIIYWLLYICKLQNANFISPKAGKYKIKYSLTDRY